MKKKPIEKLETEKHRDFFADLNEQIRTARFVKEKFIELVKTLEKKK